MQYLTRYWKCMAIISLFVAVFKLEVVNAKMCGKDKYRVKKGNKITCLLCSTCAHGEGLDPPCGSLIEHPPNVQCFPCKLGETYSDQYGPSSCKKCSHCSDHEIISKNCTVESDTVCSHTCESGYYFDNSSHDCRRCSFCCGDGSDIRIPTCKTAPRQCSFLHAHRCNPKSSKPTTPASPTTKHNMLYKTNKTSTIIAVSVAGSVVALGILVAIIYTKRRKKRRRRERGQVHQPNIDMEMNAREPLRCNLDGMNYTIHLLPYDGPQEETKELLFGSQLLLEVVCANGNNNCFEKSKFKWKKDGIELTGIQQNKLLKKEKLSILDSGCYKCFLHCPMHESNTECDNIIIVRVIPQQEQELKLFIDLPFVKRSQLEKHLKPNHPCCGNWHDVGSRYGMDEVTLKSIQGDENRAEQVIDHIHSACPDLSLYAFCEFLVTIQQNLAVKELLDNLFVTKDESGEFTDVSLNDTRDSGIDFNECPLQVALPEIKESDTVTKPPNDSMAVPVKQVALVGLNSAYSDSSREGSIDDLCASKTPILKPPNNNSNGVKLKKKRSFNRSESNQSNKSAVEMKEKAVISQSSACTGKLQVSTCF